MFERYAEAARRVLFFSRYETSQLGGASIETEHILLGLLRDRKGLTQTIFTRAKISYDEVEAEIRARGGVRERTPTSVEIPFSTATQRVLQYSAEEADRLRHSYIGTEHLLLGLLREDRSVAAAILARHGLTLESTREAIRQLLTEGTQPSWDAPKTESAGTRDQIDAIKQAIHRLAHQSSANVDDLVARIVRDLDELKRRLN
jgi:ATP-dependent Clp protease ATP-binding subunit ClpC